MTNHHTKYDATAAPARATVDTIEDRRRQDERPIQLLIACKHSYMHLSEAPITPPKPHTHDPD